MVATLAAKVRNDNPNGTGHAPRGRRHDADTGRADNSWGIGIERWRLADEKGPYVGSDQPGVSTGAQSHHCLCRGHENGQNDQRPAERSHKYHCTLTTPSLFLIR